MTEEHLVHSLYAAREIDDETLVKIKDLLNASNVYKDMNTGEIGYHFLEKRDGDS